MDNLSLLREKFTLRDVDDDQEATVAMANRLMISPVGLDYPLIQRVFHAHNFAIWL